MRDDPMIIASAARTSFGRVMGELSAVAAPALGASGARIMVTLLAALREYGLKRGIVSRRIGGGGATAIAFEHLLG